MYARLTQIKADPARTDELVEQLKAELIPVFEKQPGYLGTISSADRSASEIAGPFVRRRRRAPMITPITTTHNASSRSSSANLVHGVW